MTAKGPTPVGPETLDARRRIRRLTQHPLQRPLEARLPTAGGILSLGEVQRFYLIILSEQIGEVQRQRLLAEILPIVIRHHDFLLRRQRLLGRLDLAVGGDQQRAGLKLRVLRDQVGGVQRALAAGAEVNPPGIQL